MSSTKSNPTRPRPRTPAAPSSWPAAAAMIVLHLRPYLGAALLVLVVVTTAAVAFVLVRSCRVTVGSVQATCAQ